MVKKLQPFLADTLWFGMTSRISFIQLKEYAHKRKNQGFNTLQVVIGIPPEVGPLNPNASGDSGPAWDLEGNPNNDYLQDCEARVKMLNEEGIKVIIYGAWGHQINWIGVQKMNDWWELLIQRFEKYDVLFCLCGESNLWIGQSTILLPDKSTQDFVTRNKFKRIFNYFPFNKIPISRLSSIINFLVKIFGTEGILESLSDRKNNWSKVAEQVYQKTKLPLFIHTVHTESSLEAIFNPEILSAVTTQTGHDENTRNRHWRDPIRILQANPKLLYINLEPWYEGILDNFYVRDQLFSYWATMMAGTYAYCYGAHGIWNCGDGKFLSQWGKQTFEEAMQLETPKLIGSNHLFFMDSGAIDYPFVEVEEKNDTLISITRKKSEGDFIQYFPNYVHKSCESHFKYFDPLKGELVKFPETSGPMVVLGNL